MDLLTPHWLPSVPQVSMNFSLPSEYFIGQS
jgi:hypothetical protein